MINKSEGLLKGLRPRETCGGGEGVGLAACWDPVLHDGSGCMLGGEGGDSMSINSQQEPQSERER